MASKALQLLAFQDAMPLARAIAAEVRGSVQEMQSVRFANGQIQVRPPLEIDPAHSLVLVQVFPDDVHGRLFELVLGLSALKALMPRRIIAVLPQMPYARSDRPAVAGADVPFRRVADMIERAGADAVITVALHAPQLAGAFSIPVIDVDPTPSLVRRLPPGRYAVISPDLGGAKRASLAAELLEAPLVVMRKRRGARGKQAYDLIGALDGRSGVFVDDEINSGETLRSAIDLGCRGVERVFALVIHANLTPAATRRLQTPPVAQLIVTDSVGARLPEWVEAVPLAPLLAQALVNGIGGNPGTRG